MRKVICTRKTYITVIAYHELTGETQPLYIYFGDGRQYKIDKVIRQFDTVINKYRGEYDRTFLVRIGKRQAKIYIESGSGKWYVQEKVYADNPYSQIPAVEKDGA
ncbi:MAG: hypothetical protein PUB11_01825 [Oscillospiraceae bacterium]|nr:hypothetical protein [Oscillospiraceae bacterium]